MHVKRVGLVGWRGMVGSVLMQRMQEERDFDHIEAVFFSTSNVGGKAPSSTRSLRVRAAITQKMYFRVCAALIGRAIGLMQPLRCA
jgi:aspartate-semialdehyde dehydrogenase